LISTKRGKVLPYGSRGVSCAKSKNSTGGEEEGPIFDIDVRIFWRGKTASLQGNFAVWGKEPFPTCFWKGKKKRFQRSTEGRRFFWGERKSQRAQPLRGWGAKLLGKGR